MKRIFLLMYLACGGLSCNAQQTNNSIPLKYTNEEIGWSCNYPSDWTTLSNEEKTRIEEKGKDAMEKTVHTKIEMNNKDLLDLKKDPFNMFTSTMQPFDSITQGPYGATQNLLFNVIIETYKSKGIQLDYKIGNATIDGLEFKTLEATLYTKDRKKIILNQISYDRLFNGKMSLFLSINYNNEKDKQVLLSILKTSKFKKRK